MKRAQTLLAGLIQNHGNAKDRVLLQGMSGIVTKEQCMAHCYHLYADQDTGKGGIWGKCL